MRQLGLTRRRPLSITSARNPEVSPCTDRAGILKVEPHLDEP